MESVKFIFLLALLQSLMLLAVSF